MSPSLTPAILTSIASRRSSPFDLTARLLLGAGAVATALWLGLSYRSELLQTQAEFVAIQGKAATAAQTAEALQKARQARAFQPDTRPKLVEWLVLHFQGRDRQAQSVAEGGARRETWK